MLMSSQQTLYQSGAKNPFVVAFAGTTEIFDVCERGGTYIAGGSNGKVFKSTDGGKSWTTYDLTALIGWSGDVRVVFYSHGFFPNSIRVWGANNQQAYSDNNGTTWTNAPRSAPSPADAVTDVDDTNGYLLGSSDSGGGYVSVGGEFSGGVNTADSWLTCCRDPNNITHVLMGTGNKINYGIFGWPPPAGHQIGTLTKGTTATTLGAYFDNSQNLMFINADGTYGYKNQPAYSTTNPTIYSNATLTSGTLKGLTHDRYNNNQWMICGAKGGTDRLWMSTQASPHTWTELNPYSGYGVSYWNRVDRDNTRGNWLTGGRNLAGVGCIGVWKV